MRAKAPDVSSVHYNSIKHARDVCTRTLSSYNKLELTNHSAHLLGHFIKTIKGALFLKLNLFVVAVFS